MRYLYNYIDDLDNGYLYGDNLFDFIKSMAKQVDISEVDNSHNAKLIEVSQKFRKLRKYNMKKGTISSQRLAIDLLDGLGLLEDFKVFKNNFCTQAPYTDDRLSSFDKLKAMYNMQNIKTILQGRLSGICSDLLSNLTTAGILYNITNNIDQFVDEPKLVDVEMQLLDKHNSRDKFIDFLETDLYMYIHQHTAKNKFIELCEKYLPQIYKEVGLETLEYVTIELVRYTDHISDTLLQCVYNRFSNYINNQKRDDKIELYNRKINLTIRYATEFSCNEYLYEQFEKKSKCIKEQVEIAKGGERNVR